MAKVAHRSIRKESLSVTFSLLAFVFLGTVMHSNGTIQAMIPVETVSSSSQSSKPMTRKELREAQRLKRLLKAKKTTTSSSAAPVTVAPPRESPRLIRMKTAAPDAPGANSVRPTVILQKAGCGDGLVITPEACDDGNKESGDGCSASCTYETGFDCNRYSQPTTCKERCGNGSVSPRETCDDGNTDSNDGCDSSCRKELGFLCTTGEPNVCTTVCGDGILTLAEECDDSGTLDDDGCSSSCELE